MRKNSKKPLPIFENITITDVASEGKAIAKVDDLVIFVPYVAPGDVVDLQLVKKKKNFAEAKAIRFHQLSDQRAEPVCLHFGTCGGCKWQHLPYTEQLRYKQQEVASNLQRIGKIELPEIEPILGSAAQTFYRNKLEFTFSNKRWRTFEEMALIDQVEENPNDSNALGFHIPGMFDKVLNIESCHLQSELSNRIRLSIRQYAYDHNLTFFDLRRQEGFLRTLMIRTATTGDLMVVLIVYYEDAPLREALLDHIAAAFPEITSLLYVINTKCNDTITDQTIHLYRGNDHIVEQMEGLRFKIQAKSFYQTNSNQAYELYKITREFAALTGNELVYDLYTGTGTIANFVARSARQVVGIEYVPEAIEDAKVNSALNGIENTLFYAGDMKDVLNQAFLDEHGRPDVIITDPPRAGMHDDVIKTILAASPQRIVYVSCNSATQARDLALLDVDYTVRRIRPVDMFPHTHHVENVVLLERR